MKPSWTTLARSLVQGGLQLVYPKLCWVCGVSLSPTGAELCPACHLALTDDPNLTCPRCSSTVGPFAQLDQGCPACRDAHFPFERTLRLGPYDGLLRELVLRLKQPTGEGLAEVVGRMWVRHARPQLEALQAEVVVPIPLHWWRRWQRGYNQAETVARAVAEGLSLPCWPRCLRRVRNTPKQTHQSSPTSRKENVRGAFALSRTLLTGKRILLIDDVMTTGATLAEAARALRRGGAKAVVAAVLAHGHGQ